MINRVLLLVLAATFLHTVKSAIYLPHHYPQYDYPLAYHPMGYNHMYPHSYGMPHYGRINGLGPMGHQHSVLLRSAPNEEEDNSAESLEENMEVPYNDDSNYYSEPKITVKHNGQMLYDSDKCLNKMKNAELEEKKLNDTHINPYPYPPMFVDPYGQQMMMGSPQLSMVNPNEQLMLNPMAQPPINQQPLWTNSPMMDSVGLNQAHLQYYAQPPMLPQYTQTPPSSVHSSMIPQSAIQKPVQPQTLQMHPSAMQIPVMPLNQQMYSSAIQRPVLQPSLQIPPSAIQRPMQPPTLQIPSSGVQTHVLLQSPQIHPSGIQTPVLVQSPQIHPSGIQTPVLVQSPQIIPSSIHQPILPQSPHMHSPEILPSTIQQNPSILQSAPVHPYQQPPIINHVPIEPLQNQHPQMLQAIPLQSPVVPLNQNIHPHVIPLEKPLQPAIYSSPQPLQPISSHQSIAPHQSITPHQSIAPHQPISPHQPIHHNLPPVPPPPPCHNSLYHKPQIPKQNKGMDMLNPNKYMDSLDKVFHPYIFDN